MEKQRIVLNGETYKNCVITRNNYLRIHDEAKTLEEKHRILCMAVILFDNIIEDHIERIDDLKTKLDELQTRLQWVKSFGQVKGD